MSELIKHECGIALIRLKKPMEYYAQKYGSPLYGFQKLFLLMEKQHNRGQDGAGIGCVKLNWTPGTTLIFSRIASTRSSFDAKRFHSCMGLSSLSRKLKKVLAESRFQGCGR